MVKPEEMTFEDFKAMVKGRSDKEILEEIKGNEEMVLDGLFEKHKEAFVPEKAPGQSAVFQYDIETPMGEKSYQIVVKDGACTILKEGSERPRVTLKVNIQNFIRMMAEELTGMKAVMLRKLKISGDILFSQNLNRWFVVQKNG